MRAATALSLLLSLPVALPSAYLGALTVLSKKPPAKAPRINPTTRFCFVVPAHDEEAGISATVESLLAVDYPKDLFTVIVVADNGADATADRARSAGARVIERADRAKRGKGYALERAFETLLDEGGSDAVVVVDADTTVSPNLLRAFDARVAEGEVAMQAEYGVRNADASWRTRLMTIAFSIFHGLRGNARESLGLSAGLRGNGMAFTTRALREVPHHAYSLVEDVEYGIRLGRAGHRFAHFHEARVFGDMVAGEEASRSQRKRWEDGRAKLRREHALPLFREAIAKRSLLLFDLAADLVVPPLSTIALGAFAGLSVASLYLIVRPTRGIPVVLPWAFSAAAIAAYVARGTLLSDAGARGFVDLAYAPVYVAWKTIRRQKDKAANGSPTASGAGSTPEWVRTERGK
ncbi:glycosyltransferase family 2 protein [soil metagenome]